MAKIDELITAAQKAVEQSTEADKASNEAYLKALQDAKQANIALDQDEVNAIAKSEREKAETDANKAWTDTLGMELKEAQDILGDMSDEELANLLPAEGSEGSSDGNGEGEGESMSERIKNALAERDQAIESERERINTLSQSLYSERVENGLKEALRQKGLKDGRFDLARKLSGEADFVKKLMDGEQLEENAFSKAADSLYESSPEWFADSSESGDQRTIGSSGLKLREGAGNPSGGIPPTPEPRSPGELTDEQRAERAASAY